MRASIYNAMPIEGVKRLVEYMKEFEAKRGGSLQASFYGYLITKFLTRKNQEET